MGMDRAALRGRRVDDMKCNDSMWVRGGLFVTILCNLPACGNDEVTSVSGSGSSGSTDQTSANNPTTGPDVPDSTGTPDTTSGNSASMNSNPSFPDPTEADPTT